MAMHSRDLATFSGVQEKLPEAAAPHKTPAQGQSSCVSEEGAWRRSHQLSIQTTMLEAASPQRTPANECIDRGGAGVRGSYSTHQLQWIPEAWPCRHCHHTAPAAETKLQGS